MTSETASSESNATIAFISSMLIELRQLPMGENCSLLIYLLGVAELEALTLQGKTTDRTR